MSSKIPKYIRVHHPDGSYDTLPYPSEDDDARVEVAYDTNSPHACKRYKLAWAESDQYDCFDAEWAWPAFLNYVPYNTSNYCAVWDKNNCNEPEWKYDEFVPDEIDSGYVLEKAADIVVDILGERIGAEWQRCVDSTGGALVWDFNYDDVEVLTKECLGDIVDLGSKTKGFRLIAMCDDLEKAFDELYGNAAEGAFDDWQAQEDAARAVLEKVLNEAHDGKGLNWLCKMVNDFTNNRPYGPLAMLPKWAYRIYDDAVWYYDPDELQNIGSAAMSDDERAKILDKDIIYASHLIEGDPMDQLCSVFLEGHDPDAPTEDDEAERMRYFGSYKECDAVVVERVLTPPYGSRREEYALERVPFWDGRGDKPEGTYWTTLDAEECEVMRKYIDHDKETLREGDTINRLLHVSNVATLESNGDKFVQYTTELGKVSHDALVFAVGDYMNVQRCVNEDACVINGHVFMPWDFHVDLSKCEKDDLISANLFDMMVTRKEIQGMLDLLRRVFDTEEEAAKYLEVPVEDVASDTYAQVLGATGRVAVFR